MNHNRRRGGKLDTLEARPRRERKPGPRHFDERVFSTRSERDEFWEQQMLRHPNVVRDTGVAAVAPFATVWRVRWPR
jgi:hypothetical protein